MNRIENASVATVRRREWAAANREASRATNKRWAEKNWDSVLAYNRDRHYRHKFGITAAQKDALVLAADGKCEICRKTMLSRRDTHLDHDHATGKLRGILCGACNRRLGWYEPRRDAVNAYLAKEAKK